MPRSINRRLCLAGSLKAAAVGALAWGAPAVVRGKNLNGKVRVGFVGTGGRCGAHINTVLKLYRDGQPVEAAAVCDVYTLARERAAAKITKESGVEPFITGDYRDVVARGDIDAVCIATPDHWHSRITLNALAAGKHVYCEKPMTRYAHEASQVVEAWKESGRVMQVGSNGASDPRLLAVNDFIRQGHLGKIVQMQVPVFRNSGMGQWRYYKLEKEMTPATVDWKTFLGVEQGLAPDMPFDRAVYKQWRCYWPFGMGVFSDLFIHSMTYALIALGLRYPRRVTAGGGIFLEYDTRDVPDTVTMVADYDEGLQIVTLCTMCNEDWPATACIRGHHGTLVYASGSDGELSWPEKIRQWAMSAWPLGNWSGYGFDFYPERPQVTRTSKPQPRHVAVPYEADTTAAHWRNFLEAIDKNDPAMCRTTPELGAAAVATVTMAADSYRQGKVYEWDARQGKAVESGPGYASGWEKMSASRSAPRQIPGWNPYDKDPLFSRQIPNDYQALEGPWTDGTTDPAAGRS